MPTPPLELWNGPAATSIDEVLARMASIALALPEADGIARFNALYRKTTENIRAFAIAGKFADRDALERLDVVFANLYFRGVGACLAGEPDAPRAWLPLVESREAKGVHPLQFAMAGMNAHINRDLAVALRDTYLSRDVFPRKDGPEHADYLVVNDVLAKTEVEVKALFEDAWLAQIDEDLGTVDDRLALFSIARARDAAWTWGEALFALRAHPTLGADALLAVDRMAALASRRALLVPL